MQYLKNKFQKISKRRLQVIGVLFLLLLAVFLLWYGNANSIQSVGATAAQVYFEGEYRIADGDWQPVAEGVHIPATKGDVTLRGKLHMKSPGGEYIGVFNSTVPIAI